MQATANRSRKAGASSAVHSRVSIDTGTKQMSVEQVQRLRAAIPDDAECVVAIYPDGEGTVLRSFNMTYEQLIDLLHRMAEHVKANMALAEMASSSSVQ